MRKILSFFVVAVLYYNSSAAQIHIYLEEKEINLKDGKYSAWSFPVSLELDEAFDDFRQFSKTLKFITDCPCSEVSAYPRHG